MPQNFQPAEELILFCNYCKKLFPAQLERGVANSGRTIDRQSTFEYYCQKCQKTMCYQGIDLISEENKSKEDENEIREYNSQEHFHIGEKIHHNKFKDTGTIVGKDIGTNNRIFVNFEKSGLKKLIEDIS